MSEEVVPVREDFNPPPTCDDGRCRDVFLEFIYCAVIPSGVILLLAFIVAVVLCCTGCRKKKKEEETDDTQLQKYNSIRRASLNLRQLTFNRDTPLLSTPREERSGSLTLDREHRSRRGIRGRHGCQSAPGTLQRDRKRRSRNRDSDLLPPEYRIPPGYDYPPGQTNLGATGSSGVEYAEVHHGMTPESTQERLVS